MSDTTSNNKELILPPGRFAHIVDETSGAVQVYNGPVKSSLSPTDRPVLFNINDGTFQPVPLERAIRSAVVVNKGSYAILLNPERDGVTPELGKKESINYNKLRHGETANIPGPTSFALWPGQSAKVVAGHQLGYNQYLKVRVYDEDAAIANWEKGIIKAASITKDIMNAVQGQDQTTQPESDKLKVDEVSQPIIRQSILSVDPKTLFTGQLIILKGTEVSFYIPPSGIEVIPDETDNNNYIRNAVTLERLEYCILLDQSGRKRYVKGPSVVFPTTTEVFITRTNSQGELTQKFRAYELTPISGIHIKVISEYTEDGISYKEGDELFITGKEQAIYYPREEHATINYGDREIYYAIAIPKGEARYILNRLTGKITTICGETSYLPNPRTEVVVQRILSDSECNLFYPGNQEALEFNRKLRGIEPQITDNSVQYYEGNRDLYASAMALTAESALASRAARSFSADSMTRQKKFTPPRTITFNASRFTGAVSVSVWSGFAIQIVDKAGSRRVVIGPSTALLDYDETLEVLSLSTGKPKNTDNLLRTVYLSVHSNAITDIISVESSEMIPIELKIKYLVKFDGDSSKWFSISNYVKYLSDHMRSLLSTSIRKINVRDFYASSLDVIKSIVFGSNSEFTFDENNMTIYGVDLLSIRIGNKDIETRLQEAPHKLLQLQMDLELETANSDIKIQSDGLRKQRANSDWDARKELLRILEEEKAIGREQLYNSEMATLDLTKSKADLELIIQDILNKVNTLKLGNRTLEESVDHEIASNEITRNLRALEAETKASETLLTAVQPELIAVLQQLAQSGMLQSMAEHLAPLALISDMSLTGTARKLLANTPLEQVLDNLQNLQYTSGSR